MHRTKYVKIAIPILTLLLLNSLYLAFSASSMPKVQDVPPWDFPRLDTMYYVEAWPAATARTMALECKIDVFLGATSTSDVDALVGAGWSVTHSGGGLHYCYFGFNCRDVVPPWTTEYTPYHGRSPGFSLFPLNESSFRLALGYIIGCERTSWCWDLMKYIVVRNDFPMPPGFGEWRNPFILEFPEDWAFAEDILMENGFTVVKGNPSDRTTWIWYCPNGMKLVGGKNSGSPGSARPAGTDGTFGFYVMAPPATVSIEFVSRHCKKWNEFFTGEANNDGLADPLMLFHAENMASSGDMINIVWYQREHDLFYLCGSFGARNPDYLYDTFSSDQDIEGGNNDPGLYNPGLDKLLWAIKFFQMKDFEILAFNTGEDPEVFVYANTHFTIVNVTDLLDVKIERSDKTGVYYEYLTEGVDYSLTGSDMKILKDITLNPGDALELNYNTGTYLRIIYDVNFYRDVVWLADWKVFFLVPQMGNYGRDYYDLFKPGHDGWVNAAGYGAGAYNLPYTSGEIEETGVPIGGSMKWQSAGDVVTLNPIKERWVYEVEITNRILEGMITRDPMTGTEVPWIGTKMEESAWNAPEGIPGMKIRFYIRNDVYWQDGKHVTTQDIKWDLDYIAHICPDIGTPFPEFVTLWSYYKGSTIIDDYTIDIYVNTTGHWKTLDFAGSILIFPKIIWESLQNYADATAFKPWAVLYRTWTGQEPTGSISGDVLTCLIGTGPYYMVSWNEADLAQLNKNPDYWLSKAGKLANGVVVWPSFGSSLSITFNSFNAPALPITVNWKVVAQGYTAFTGSITINTANTAVTVTLPIDQDYGAWYYIEINGTIVYRNYSHVLGDLGSGPPPTFGKFDGVVDAWDFALWAATFFGTAPANATYLGDLGNGPPPTYFAFNGAVDAWDFALWANAFFVAPPANP